MDPHAKRPYSALSGGTVNQPPIVPSTQPVDLIVPTSSLETSPARLTRVSWGAILAGAAFAAVLQIWFQLLGLAIGLAAFNPLAEQATGFGIGAGIWILATSVISLFCGGWLAGRLTGSPSQLDRSMHGAVTWSVATLFGLWIIGSGLTSAIAGTASVAGDIAGAAAPAMGSAAGALSERVQGALPQEVESDLKTIQADSELRQAVMSYLASGANPNDREQLIVQLTDAGVMDRAEAESTLVGWEQRATEAKYKVADVSEKAANTLSAVAFLGALSMFLGLGSAALGGAMAYDGRRRVVTRRSDLIVSQEQRS